MKKTFFIEAFLKNPLKIGAIASSSKFLAEKMIEPIDFRRAKYIVEFGAGTGVFTKTILNEMSGKSILFSFEINKNFVSQIEKSVNDKRFKIINDRAENFEKYLKKAGINKVDCFISGLPLAALPKEEARRLLFSAKKYLNNGGLFVQFQYFLTDLAKLKKIFSSVSINFEPRNIPPAFIYICRD